MRAVILFLLLALPLGAQTVPSSNLGRADGAREPGFGKPAAGAPVSHHFYDRFAKIELASAGSLAVTDSVITCRFLARGQREMNLPTQSCAGMVGLQLAFYGAGEGLSFLLHRTGHHKLERLPRLYLAYANASGIAFTAQHGGI